MASKGGRSGKDNSGDDKHDDAPMIDNHGKSKDTTNEDKKKNGKGK